MSVRSFTPKIGVPFFLVAILAPFVFGQYAFAYDIPAGCRAATQADMTARRDRGIFPVDQPVCPGDVIYLGIGQNFDQWFARIKSQSPCNRNTCTLSCRTRNTGAQVCGGYPGQITSQVARRWNAIGCHPNNNTAIFPTVSHGFAAHIDLLRDYCGKQGRCTIARVQQQWSTANKAAYADFVSRMSGIPQNQVFDPNDIELMGRLALAMSCFEAGALPYNVEELKQGLTMAAGGERRPVPSNVGELLNESLLGSYGPSANPGMWQQPPFSGQPFMGSQQTGYGTNYASPTSLGTPATLGGSQGVRTDGEGQYNPSTSDPVPGGISESNIMLWPKTVERRGSLTVIWTSVNMKKDSCQVLFDGQEWAKANEGSKLFTTVTSDATLLKFTLRCEDSKGQIKEVSSTATIQ